MSSEEYLHQFPDAKFCDEESRAKYIEAKSSPESIVKQREVMKQVRKKYYSNSDNRKEWYKKVCDGNKIAGKKWLGVKRPECSHVAWNKGLTNETDEKTKQISLKRSNPRSEQGRQNIKLGSIKRSKENKQWRENNLKANRLIGQSKKGIPRPIEVMRKILNPKKPTSIERLFIELIAKYNLPYRYVGNGDVWISNMNPDFINTNSKKEVVELYGNFWHKGQNPQDRIDKFKQYGFECKVIWEKEFKYSDWEQRVLGALLCH
jgi:hypothetical protein